MFLAQHLRIIWFYLLACYNRFSLPVNFCQTLLSYHSVSNSVCAFKIFQKILPRNKYVCLLKCSSANQHRSCNVFKLFVCFMVFLMLFVVLVQEEESWKFFLSFTEIMPQNCFWLLGCLLFGFWNILRFNENKV